jgi:acyl-CoA thioesterase
MPDETESLAALRRTIAEDPFAARLGIRVEDLQPGYCRTSLTLSPEMLNGVGVPHGGVIFSLADQALAGASNSRGSALTLSITIGYVTQVSVGSRVVAEAREAYLGRRTGLYLVTVTDEAGTLVAACQATAYRKE